MTPLPYYRKTKKRCKSYITISIQKIIYLLFKHIYGKIFFMIIAFENDFFCERQTVIENLMNVAIVYSPILFSILSITLF